MKAFSEIFEAFGGPARFASAIGIKPFHAQTMRARDSIPPSYWTRVVEAADDLGIKNINTDRLASLAATKRERRAA